MIATGSSPNNWLLAGAGLSGIAALLHLAIIAGGPDWYRFFHAGPRMVALSQRDPLHAAVVAIAIAAVLTLWACYALSGAGVIARLPLLRLGLVTISAIYLLRGLALPYLLVFRPQGIDGFWVWSSLIVFGFGLTYAIGTAQTWTALAK